MTSNGRGSCLRGCGGTVLYATSVLSTCSSPAWTREHGSVDNALCTVCSVELMCRHVGAGAGAGHTGHTGGGLPLALQ